MSIKKRNDKIKVGLVQINNSFDQQNYVPLSVGFLHSYAQTHAQNFDEFEFLKEKKGDKTWRAFLLGLLKYGK